MVNLTNADTRITLIDHGVMIVRRDGTVARLDCERFHGCGFQRVNPVLASKPVRVTGLPEPVKGTLFIVTDDVRAFLPDRKDLASVSGHPDWPFLIFNP